MSIRRDYVCAAAEAVRMELWNSGIRERHAAACMGLSNSTFNSFLNADYTRLHRKTLDAILSVAIWSERTRCLLEAVRDYDELAMSGKLPSISPGKFAAE